EKEKKEEEKEAPLTSRERRRLPEKNRKKKERQKLKKSRQKLASAFHASLQSSVPLFLSNLTSALSSTHSINTSSYQCDHVCWRTATQSSYDSLTLALNSAPHLFSLLVEGPIGGRMISTY
ncbi:hypothetical protein TrRE_jg11299, partial [Triparma retinervis]